MKARTTTSLGVALILALASAGAAQSTLVADGRAAVNRGDLAAAERLVASARVSSSVAPETLEASSWLARGALAAHDFGKADRYARETEKQVLGVLKTRPLDADKHLPI